VRSQVGEHRPHIPRRGVAFDAVGDLVVGDGEPHDVVVGFDVAREPRRAARSGPDVRRVTWQWTWTRTRAACRGTVAGANSCARHDGVREWTLEITFVESGVEAYAFTFGVAETEES
jgi:predicted Zn-dependent protease